MALADESIAGVVQRPGRSILTVVGTVLGVGALVAVLGLTTTAQGQISDRFTVLSATEVTVEQAEGAGVQYTGGGGVPYMAFPDDAAERVEALNGVRHAGLLWPVDNIGGAATAISALPPGTESGESPQEFTVFAATPGALAASRPQFLLGRSYDTFHEGHAEQVAVLGPAVARSLGISRLDGFPAIFINDTPFTVIGILDDVERNAEFLLSVLIPANTSTALWGLPDKSRPKMIIETDVGAAQLIGSQVAVALRPDNPALFRVVTPPDPTTLRDNVSTDLNTLFLALAGVSLLIGTFGIANTTLVAVLERVPEIGLRRSLGARPRHIAAQFLSESALLGTVGGVVGAALGIVTVLAVAVGQEWSAIIPTWLPASAGLGTITGVIAGLYPSWRATRIEPADALRR